MDGIVPALEDVIQDPVFRGMGNYYLLIPNYYPFKNHLMLSHYLHLMDHNVTNREVEVLRHLANGVESYRRQLLKKYEAKNSAELIKKASKIFGLHEYVKG